MKTVSNQGIIDWRPFHIFYRRYDRRTMLSRRTRTSHPGQQGRVIKEDEKGRQRGRKIEMGIRQSIHAVAVVLIAEFTQHVVGSVLAEDGEGGMVYAVEHAGLHRGVVDHVLEDNLLPYLQLMVKAP